jgi:transcription elongation factor Elf1
MSKQSPLPPLLDVYDVWCPACDQHHRAETTLPMRVGHNAAWMTCAACGTEMHWEVTPIGVVYPTWSTVYGVYLDKMQEGAHGRA